MRIFAALIFSACLGSPLAAQDASAQIAVEVNALDQQEDGCRLSFLIDNQMPSDIETVVFETVLFDTKGRVAQLTLFDFGALPVGRPRVRQFVLGGQSCDQIGQILFNGAATCDGEGLSPAQCDQALRLTTRTDIEVAG